MTPRRHAPGLGPRVALTLALAALSTSCRRLRARPRGTVPATVSAAGRWTASVASADALRALDGHYLVGGLRRTDAAWAPPPYPARPLVSAARVAGAWRFAAADGTLYRAPDFLGPLTVVAAVPESARATDDGDAATVVRGVFHDGALGYLDHTGRAWTLDRAVPRALALSRVISVVFASARRVLAVTSPGVLHLSDDGGRRFAVVPLPPGDLPTAVGLVRGVAVVEAYRGRYSITADGTLDPGAPSLEAFVRAGELPLGGGAPPPLVLPADPARVAALSDGSLAVVDGDLVRVIDPRTGRELSRAETPGRGCVIAGADGSFRLLCTHDGWAAAAFAPAAGGAWTTVRDELRAEPMGAMVFDDRSGAWVVAAPCARQPVRDPEAFCVHSAGAPDRTVRAPFPARPADLHDGAALLVETSDTGPRARAVILRGEAMTTVTLPVGVAEARGLRWAAGALAVWGRRADGRPVLHRGALGAGGDVRWTDHEAPAGAVRGVHGEGGVAYALGRGADAMWRYRPGAGFARMAGPVRGDAAALPLDPEGLSYCAGAVCRLAGVLEWTLGAAGGPWFVARPGASPAPPPSWVSPPQRAAERSHYACASGGALGPGPELDAGVAVSGYALRWQPERDGLTVRWAGGAFSGEVRGRLAPTVEAVTFAGYAPVGAADPVALVDRCAGARCETFLATAARVQPFPLEHFPRPFRRDVVRAEGGAYLALSRGASHGATVAQAIAFRLDGQVTAQRTVVTDAPPEFVQPGSLDGRDGLWVPSAPRRWRFVPLEGEGTDETVEDDGALAPCGPDLRARGVLRRIDRGAEIRGDGWALVPGAWQVEELLEVTAAGLCVRAIAGGESRDRSAVARRRGERDAVRSFSVVSDGAGGLAGEAWQGRRRVAMVCARVEGRRTMTR